ncbi:hypothetical protein [Micromonospora sp. NPDC048063]|uniref:hypothetical protein n=1 Tax=Micromonospora sp. NPDC048063 TaxID=3364256 RepID=UPI00371BFCD0
MTRTRHYAGALLLLAALAGCTSAPEPAAAPSSPPATTSAAAAAPPVDGGTYESPLLLVDALVKGGINCARYEAVAQPTGAVARGSCWVGAEEYTIGIYASAADAREQPNAEAEMLEGVADVDLVLGRNWTVGCPDPAACRAVAAVLGGEVFHDAA